MEAVGVEREWERRGKSRGIGMRDKGEMKRKRRTSPGRVQSPRETIGLDKERETELCRESLINWLFI